MSEGGRADTSSMLFSVHKHLQARCADRSAAYLACKKNDQNPAACLEEGAKVTGCMLDLLKVSLIIIQKQQYIIVGRPLQ